MSDVKHSAATGAKHVPGQIKQAKPRSVQESPDGLFLIEGIPGGERQHVDTA
jgi:hypothetical protein